jgi:DDE family transposase
LYVFCGDELLVAYLRPSNIDASKHARAVLKLLVRRLRAAWPEVKITIRGDSGFCRWRLMRWCDAHGIGYVLGLAKNPVLERAARDEIERAAWQFRQTRAYAPK